MWESQLSLGLAELFGDLGLMSEATTYYQSAVSIAERACNKGQLASVSIAQANYYRRCGNRDRATRTITSLGREFGPTLKPQVQLAKAALEVSERPSRARGMLEGLLRQGHHVLYAEERILAQYLLSRAAWGMADEGSAKKLLGEALFQARQTGAEQVIARELHSDKAFRSYAETQFPNSDAFDAVLDRIAMMSTLARKFQARSQLASRPAAIRVLAMGENQILLNNRVLASLPPLSRHLAAYMIDVGPVQRDRILEDFWPMSSKGRQIANFHSTLYCLRGALGKTAILQQAGTYVFNPKVSVQFDVSEFEQAAGRAQSIGMASHDRLAEFKEAIGLYKGEFLPGCFQEWAGRRREALNQKYLALARAFAQAALQSGQAHEAAQELGRALALDPYDDDLNVLYLETLGRLGRRAQLVAHYQRYCRLLTEELGLDPPDRARSLYAAMIG